MKNISVEVNNKETWSCKWKTRKWVSFVCASQFLDLLFHNFAFQSRLFDKMIFDMEANYS